MRVRLRFFAALRERLGTESEEVDVPVDVTTVAGLRQWLTGRGGAWAEALGEGRNVRAAMNLKMVHGEARLERDAELAFFPPVTGG